eukprot:TRINITY_DN3248_c0_g1_i1.p2 TRINITY_DN3248_c0_g1~~TRINITY_DN3248_c0_g1_i1.p2  ORF type:complete len:266 (-),score=41.61 TRINITY_DN3248_c0_g1_i1:661-1458(-)
MNYVICSIVLMLLVQQSKGQSAQNDRLLDVYFLADNTGSMSEEIEEVRSKARFLFDSFASNTTQNIRFGVGAYRDQEDEYVFWNIQSLVEEDLTVPVDEDKIVMGMNQWDADGGDDEKEAQLYALYQIATTSYEEIGWRDDAVKLIVWFGDASGHDPSGENEQGEPITEELVIEALVAKNIKISGIDVESMNESGQVQRIADATGGNYAQFDPDQELFESTLPAPPPSDDLFFEFTITRSPEPAQTVRSATLVDTMAVLVANAFN